MIKRKYKIVEEKRPSDNFTRWTPMVANTINNYGEILTDENLIWEVLPYGVVYQIGYCKSKEESMTLIDRYENYQQEHEGKFIVGETNYEPKQR